MQVISAGRVDVRTKQPTKFEEKHGDLLRDFTDAVDVLLRLRDWRGVPTDIRGHWVGIQAATIDAKNLWLASTKWPQPSRAEVQRMWQTFALLRHVMPSDGKLVLLMSADISLKKLAAYHDCSVPEMGLRFERAIEQIADGIAAEEAQAA